MRAQTLTPENLRKQFVSRAIRNIKRGYADDESGRGMFRSEIRLDLQRSRLMTESYKATEGEAMVLRRAKALANILNKMGIFIRDYERIVGYQTAEPNGIFHPIEQNWKSPQRLANSPAGKTLLDDAGRKELDELCKYWKGKSISDRHQAVLPEDLKKYWTYEGTFLWSQLSELGIPNYEKLFNLGLQGLINEIREKMARLDQKIPADYVEQKDFLTASIISLEAVINFAKRYAVLAKESAVRQKNATRKKILEEIAETCAWVPANPPRTFIEAIQFFYFIHLVRYLEYSTLGIGVRIDYLFGPYYEKDLKEGKITKEETLGILQLLWIKLNELGLVYSPTVSSVYSGVASLQAVTIGGTDEKGRDVTNDLTYLTMEAAKSLKIIEPSIALRVHEGTPDEVYSRATDVIKTGIGYPSLFNDEALIPLYERWGVPKNEAKQYAVSGCVYIEIPGKNVVRRSVGYFVLPKCLWWALHQGVNPKTGEQHGAKTPDPATFKSWEDVLEAYAEQVKFFTSKIETLERINNELLTQYAPRPFYSALLDGCIEQGKDCRRWVYNSLLHHFSQVIGGTNVADAITAIKKIVFEDRKVTLPELITIMDKNWAGREDVRLACLNAPKFGNDDDYADEIARIVQTRGEAAMEEVKDRFGHSHRGDGSAVSATYGLAADTPATPDGRFDGEPFADSTLAPAPGRDKKGPTAVLKSCSKISTVNTFNHLLNQKFLPKFLEDDLKPAFLSYLKTWKKLKVPHIQFNVVDRETLLKAKAQPERYSDLIVRVAGFSAYFVDLSSGLQDHIIARTEQTLT
ncbi:MAG TPA: pyruvate formate lyase family protein [Smithellaceae bacterium]|nr:pyruvate formate lyase family protein [Smithellaceae bacterium]HOS09618.1 pyruvate formate lyase family protein [Smithellaceae bacterium]HQQ86939.1 pyruvate formate lyase family protein [Smithellaceae bacterium]